ncbi:MAG: hypothetical protein MR761_04090, partial [Butyricicoccus porcorum]|nr:hypothetical protein [Butyricicoccus porcorum]MDY4483846.1 hypothetical protein [Butyricicoccus porcorum]
PTTRLSGDCSTYRLDIKHNFDFCPLSGGLVLCALFRNGTQITMFQPFSSLKIQSCLKKNKA